MAGTRITQPRTHAAFTGRRYGSFAGKTATLPTDFAPHRRVLERSRVNVLELYLPRAKENRRVLVLEGGAS
jgi:hypothetical protein